MDKYIKLSDAVWVLCKETCHPGAFCPDSMCVEMWDKFKDIPPADVQPVVRCKDCKWFNKIGCAINIVDESDKPHEYDFCSFAERKDGEQSETD